MKSDFLINENFLKAIASDTDILAVYLFGSVAEGTNRPDSDIDICLFLTTEPNNIIDPSQKRIQYLKAFSYDIHIFQQLPLYIRHRVLNSGKEIYCKDKNQLYDIALSFITEYNDYEPIYKYYLEETKYGR